MPRPTRSSRGQKGTVRFCLTARQGCRVLHGIVLIFAHKNYPHPFTVCIQCCGVMATWRCGFVVTWRCGVVALRLLETISKWDKIGPSPFVPFLMISEFQLSSLYRPCQETRRLPGKFEGKRYEQRHQNARNGKRNRFIQKAKIKQLFQYDCYPLDNKCIERIKSLSLIRTLPRHIWKILFDCDIRFARCP